MASGTCSTTPELLSAIGRDGDGFAFVQGQAMAKLLAKNEAQNTTPSGAADRTMPVGLADWDAFSDSWNRLATDQYMADGGRYRKRRYATYTAATGRAIIRAPHQPHYQTLDYNPLNGGVARWFEPIDAAVSDGASMAAILGFCRTLFDQLEHATPSWHIETHQFRIEARTGEQGRPTPEGLHRDGVDYVLVLLVSRRNIASGVTTIHSLDGRSMGQFTLTHPFDAALLDDARVAHGVTPVEPIDASAPAYRDVLVVTFRKAQEARAARHSSGPPRDSESDGRVR